MGHRGNLFGISLAAALSVLPVTRALPADAPLASGRTYRIERSSARVGFDLPATMHTVHGTTADVTGEITLVEASADGFVLSGRIDVRAGSLDTGNERRDRKMHDESLAVAAHPNLSFRPKKLSAGKRDPAGSARTLYDLTGTLEIRGASKSVVIPVAVETKAGRVHVEGRLDVTWSDFGVPDPSVFLLRVDPIARAFFQIELVS
jgi:polyisoprenoid-binding protein YceI